MRNRRGVIVVAAAALAVVLAVGAAGSALAFGMWGQGTQAVQAQTPNGSQNPSQGQGQGWVCPAAGDSQTAQAMQDAMRNGDWNQMRDLMGQYGGPMSQFMQGANWEQMQQWMQNGDWDAMRNFMQQQGFGPGPFARPGGPTAPDQTQPQSSTPANGNANRGFGMMGGNAAGGFQGGMMGRR